MAIVRNSLEQIRASAPRVDRAKIAATTPADIARHAGEDGSEAGDLSTFEPTVLAQAMHHQLGVTQGEFAQAWRVPLVTLRNCEQERVRPDPAARSLLLIVARNLSATLAVLTA